mgnify:FL=1
MGKSSALKKTDRGLATIGDVVQIRPIVFDGVRQIRDHRLKESLYFKLPVVVAIKSRDLEVALKALEEMELDAAWWYSGRNKVHFAPLYPDNAKVCNFTPADKEDFKQNLGMIASCLMTRLRDLVPENVEPVELLPSIPMISDEQGEGYTLTREVGLDSGHSLNYRVLTLSHDGLKMTASFFWNNRRRGDKKKNEAMFVERDKSKLISINVEDCRSNDAITKVIVDEVFGSDSKVFRDAMIARIGDIVSDLSVRARIARRKAEDAERNRQQINSIKDAEIDW